MNKENTNDEREFISRCFDLDNVSFLIGSGLSKALGGNTMSDIAKKLDSDLSGKKLDKPVIDWVKQDLRADSLNVERFLDRLYLKKSYFHEIGQKDESNDELIDLTRQTVFDLCAFTPDREKLHLLFLFLNSLVNRKSGLCRVQLFTLNYDLLIDRCADEMGILVNDGFDGTVDRWLNTSQFDLDYYYPSGIIGDKPVRCERILNYFKLHGSLNWTKNDSRIVKGKCSHENMLIYPCQAKYDAMLCEPFSELFRRFSVSTKRPKGALIVVGYGFGDAHVNQLILQALEQPSFRLVVIDPEDNISKKFGESQRFPDRIKQLNCSFEEFVPNYLPKAMEKFAESSDKVVSFFKELIEKELQPHEDQPE
jgi:hypothetical protein